MKRMTLRRWAGVFAGLSLGCMSLAAPHAQQPVAGAALAPQDRADIEQLLAHYARALSSCSAKEYSELFTPDGVFISDDFRSARHRELYGKSATLVGRDKLVELVQTEEFCLHPDGRAARAGGGRNPLPVNAEIVATIGGAKGTIPLGSGGGHYEDVYVKTPDGWRFKSRSVFMPPAKPAASQ